MKYFLFIFSAACLIALMACAGPQDLPKTPQKVSIQSGAVSIEGVIDAGAPVTVKEYKLAISPVFKKK